MVGEAIGEQREVGGDAVRVAVHRVVGSLVLQRESPAARSEDTVVVAWGSRELI